jgi:enoyl-CoA hydratase
VVVLAAEGPHFCAGNDLHEFASMTPANAKERMRRVRAAFFAIQEAELPVIAAVHGSALGTGVAIAASCDFVVADENARFGLPEIGVGVMGGARHLGRLVPQPWVRWMYLTGETVAAQRMAELGAIIEIAPSGHALPVALEHAGYIARHSALALRTAKRSLNAIETMDLQPGYRFEQDLTCQMAGEPDAKEAVLALLEHRAPLYSDRS